MTKSKTRVYVIRKRVEARTITEALKKEKEGVIEEVFEDKREIVEVREEGAPIGFGSKTNA